MAFFSSLEPDIDFTKSHNFVFTKTGLIIHRKFFLRIVFVHFVS